MKIKEIGTECILFDNGNTIAFKVIQPHDFAFADFYYLIEETEDILEFDFPEDLTFEFSDGGFRFGSTEKKYIVPCYSCLSDINIIYQDKEGAILKVYFNVKCATLKKI